MKFMSTAEIGQPVLFYPPSNSTKSGFDPSAICAATIAKVLPSGRLNLGVLDGHGVGFPMENVPLLKDGDEVPDNGYYASFPGWKAAPPKPIPAVPASLVATAGDKQVDLSWAASSNAKSYSIKRATTTGGPYVQVGTS